VAANGQWLWAKNEIRHLKFERNPESKERKTKMEPKELETVVVRSGGDSRGSSHDISKCCWFEVKRWLPACDSVVLKGRGPMMMFEVVDIRNG
jgi:hypothetical protein